MLTIRCQWLNKREKKLLRKFCIYVMDHFLPPHVQKQARVVIEFKDARNLSGQDRRDIQKFNAWLMYSGRSGGWRWFNIVINAALLRKRSKNIYSRLREVMECIAHELVHLKQYLLNETFDYENGDVRYKGKRYRDWAEGEAYYFSPWEVESYGYEHGLYKCFRMKMESEQPS